MEIKNKFCSLSSLVSESDVEQHFLAPLLKELGYTDRKIATKMFITIESIGKGKRKKLYSPDYIIYTDDSREQPIILIDAKSPNDTAQEGVEDAQMYAFIVRKNMGDIKGTKPFCIGCNGLNFILKEYESNNVKLELKFEEFMDGNEKFESLKKLISFESVKNNLKKQPEVAEFKFEKPDITELEGIFRACHNKIWKKEKIKPTEAFYEFSKLFFLKLYNDREIHKKKAENILIHNDDFFFSEDYIKRQNLQHIENPFNILFDNLKKELKREVEQNRKKIIFEPDEKIDLKPSTIVEVVKLLQHLDLHGIDEDLNGRMFESFLNATVRGKDLGQFFTPRSVVKFMVKMADISVTSKHVDTILDGLCGSGGFLIESMAQMFEKINGMKNLTNEEAADLRSKVVSESIWGTDANKTMSRIARMNMYLHGDGSNRVYWIPDFLDKEIKIEKGIDEELEKEATEFKRYIENGKRFNIVLTNPPFSMKYSEKEEDEKRILKQYEVAHTEDKKGTKKVRSLKSNVLSLERYYDLLEPHGKLITVIDESVLNAGSEKDFRDFIRKKFIIRGVISLPSNTFVKAEANVKTSVLYLLKKLNDKEDQPDIFMAFSENVGHTDSGKPCPDKSDLEKILNKFRAFERGEKIAE